MPRGISYLLSYCPVQFLISYSVSDFLFIFDNACIESFLSYLKTEKIYLTNPQTLLELLQVIRDYVSFYNHERFQKKLNNRSP
ncbi:MULTISPECIES: IS3 family transposase [Paenibacillus]|uniref:IS3 family transposase n=1 Tax=Paenibacillus TaxID=44249 RepID=UPI003390643F